mmetsp:Transcript_66636/g.114505  ORF Transcript_66636/g.114505 Transcript_66636/m.114505 type:complete len:140 (+) Transcript_66636:150-569(+)
MNGHLIKTEVSGDPNSRLYSVASKSMYINEIDARVDRLKVKRAALQKKRMKALAVVEKGGRKTTGWTLEDTAKLKEIRARRDAAIPFLRAFKVFGAKNKDSQINSADFEMGLRKMNLSEVLDRKTVLDLFGACSVGSCV